MSVKVSLIECADYDQDRVISAVGQCLEPLGGMSAFVRSGQKVLLQVNVVQARPPEHAVCTHPSLVTAVCRMVREAGGLPFLGGSSGGVNRGSHLYFHHTRYVFEVSGIAAAAAAQNVEIVNYDEVEGQYLPQSGAVVKNLYFPRPALEADAVISLPKVKTHHITLLTGAVKNHFGLLPGARKIATHALAPDIASFGEALLDCYAALPPHLVIADAIQSMEGRGPTSGKPKPVGLLAASADGVALDAVMCAALGLDASLVPTLSAARRRRIGTTSLSDIQIFGTPLQRVRERLQPHEWPVSYRHPWLQRLGWLVYQGTRPYAVPERCDGCRACVEVCPEERVAVANGKVRIDVAARCSACLLCHEACAHQAIGIKLHWLSRLAEDPREALRPGASSLQEPQRPRPKAGQRPWWRRWS